MLEGNTNWYFVGCKLDASTVPENKEKGNGSCLPKDHNENEFREVMLKSKICHLQLVFVEY